MPTPPVMGGEGASRATLRLVQITDVYTLENFPALRTLIQEKRAELPPGCQTVSVLTGDFLMPYLLSSLDKGRGMMAMLNATPIDVVTWGNHECDLAHEHVLAREKEYKGVWINSNFTQHESYANSKCQTDVHTIEVTSPDGENKRRVSLIGLLTDSPSLYRPDSFGGKAHLIEDPYATCKRMVEKLKDTCDLVVPLEHLYEPQDERMASEVDVPVLLSGHDHHVVDKVVNGTRILKPGSDGHRAVVLDLSWPTAGSDVQVEVSAEILAVKDFKPDPSLEQVVKQAYAPLDGLLNTQLVEIPEAMRPLSSVGARDRRVSAGTFLLSEVREALNAKSHTVDCVLVKGGNIRGGRTYEPDDPFTLESLKSEISEGQELVICRVPGSVLRVGLQETWTAPNPGWFQYDDGISTDEGGFVTHVGGKPIDPERMYAIASVSDFFRARDGPSFGKYFDDHPDERPDNDTGVVIHAILLAHWADKAWKRVFQSIDVDSNGQISESEIRAIDINGDGFVDSNELVSALVRLGFKATPEELTFVRAVLLAAGDADHDGRLSLSEINKAAVVGSC